MSDFDRNTAQWGQAVPQAGRAQIDQGLRSYMLGVYNNMVIGLAITGLFAYGANLLAVTHDPAQAVAHLGNIYLTAFGQAIYFSPLKWLVVFAPLALVFFFSFQINRISASTARDLVFRLLGGDGPVALDPGAGLYRQLDRPRLLHHRGAPSAR